MQYCFHFWYRGITIQQIYLPITNLSSSKQVSNFFLKNAKCKAFHIFVSHGQKTNSDFRKLIMKCQTIDFVDGRFCEYVIFDISYLSACFHDKHPADCELTSIWQLDVNIGCMRDYPFSFVVCLNVLLYSAQSSFFNVIFLPDLGFKSFQYYHHYLKLAV